MKKVLTMALSLLIVLSMVVSAYGLATVAVTKIAADKASVTLNAGQTSKITVKFTPANTTQTLLVYSTSNKNVAAVDANGLISGVAAGSAVITVTSKSNAAVSAQVKVTVKPAAKLTLTVEVFNRGNVGGTPPDNNYWSNWIKTEYAKVNPNVTLSYVTCPRAEEVNKLNIWMASNQAPDLCYTYDTNVVYNYYKNGGLTKMDDALNAYGSQLKTFLGKDVLDRGKFYGGQWSIPARRVIIATSMPYIRTDWLDKLGMKLPTTTMEFYDTMKAFKDKNPGKVGKVVPMAMTQDVNTFADYLLQSFITDKSEKARYLTKENMRITAPGIKEGVRLLNKMYNEGLISPEFALDRDTKLMEADMANGYVGSMSWNYDNPLRSALSYYTVKMQAKIPGYKFEPVDCFKDKDGVTSKVLYSPAGLLMIVPKTSEAKANEVVKYVSWLTNKDVLFFLQYGNEGIGHDTKNGLPYYKSATGEQVMNSPNNIDYTLPINGISTGDAEKDIKINALSYGAEVQDTWMTAYKLSNLNGYVPPALSVPVDADAKYANSLKEKTYEVYAKTITCKPADFDAVWNKMITEFMNVGGNDVLKDRRAAWTKEKGIK